MPKAKTKMDKLKPRKVNPRTMSDEDRARLGKTLREFGDLGGVVLNVRSGQLVGGHQRVTEFRKDIASEVVIEQRLKTPDATGSVAFGYVMAGGTRYSYREVDWDATKEAAANLAANRVHGDWDLGGVASMLKEFDAGFDFDLTGFDALEVAEMLAQESPTAVDDDPEIDRAEELAKKWGVKTGQLWALGVHRLMCGDSTKDDDVDRLMDGEIADLCFTSPPYGAGKVAKLRDHYVRGAKKRSSFYKRHDDDPDRWANLMQSWFAAIRPRSRCVICNVQMLADNKKDLVKWVADRSEDLVDVIIWDKINAAPQMQSGVMSNAFEFLFVFGGNGSRSIPFANWHGTVSNVVRINPRGRNENSDNHRAVMPIDLALWILQTLCPKSKSIIEPFSGSGTTLMACEQTNRVCRAIELDPCYIAVAIERWFEATKGEPQLL